MRVDSHAYGGYTIPPYYDSMIGKLICYGSTRKVALERAYRALSEYLIRGIKTTIPLHRAIMADPVFIEGKATTAYMEDFLGRTATDLFFLTSANSCSSPLLQRARSNLRGLFWSRPLGFRLPCSSETTFAHPASTDRREQHRQTGQERRGAETNRVFATARRLGAQLTANSDLPKFDSKVESCNKGMPTPPLPAPDAEDVGARSQSQSRGPNRKQTSGPPPSRFLPSAQQVIRPHNPMDAAIAASTKRGGKVITSKVASAKVSEWAKVKRRRSPRLIGNSCTPTGSGNRKSRSVESCPNMLHAQFDEVPPRRIGNWSFVGLSP